MVIDGLFTEILASDRSSGKTEVQFDEVNGTIEWSPIVKVENKKKVTAVPAPTTKRRSDEETPSLRKKKQCHESRVTPVHEVITLDDDDSDEESGSEAAAPSTPSGNCAPRSGNWSSAPIELNLSDDDDDEESIMDFTMAMSRCRPCDVTRPAAAAVSATTSSGQFSEPLLSHSDSHSLATAGAAFHFLSSNRLPPHIPSTATPTDSAGIEQEDDDDDDDIAIIE